MRFSSTMTLLAVFFYFNQSSSIRGGAAFTPVSAGDGDSHSHPPVTGLLRARGGAGIYT